MKVALGGLCLLAGFGLLLLVVLPGFDALRAWAAQMESGGCPPTAIAWQALQDRRLDELRGLQTAGDLLEGTGFSLLLVLLAVISTPEKRPGPRDGRPGPPAS